MVCCFRTEILSERVNVSTQVLIRFSCSDENNALALTLRRKTSKFPSDQLENFMHDLSILSAMFSTESSECICDWRCLKTTRTRETSSQPMMILFFSMMRSATGDALFFLFFLELFFERKTENNALNHNQDEKLGASHQHQLEIPGLRLPWRSKPTSRRT